jgi:hypothetical protein
VIISPPDGEVHIIQPELSVLSSSFRSVSEYVISSQRREIFLHMVLRMQDLSLAFEMTNRRRDEFSHSLPLEMTNMGSYIPHSPRMREQDGSSYPRGGNFFGPTSTLNSSITSGSRGISLIAFS